jgi:hypothetical protein
MTPQSETDPALIILPDQVSGWDERRGDLDAGAHKWPGVVATVFVLLFAFLLASFPVRNHDIWGHLAAGRALVTGAREAGGSIDLLPSTGVSHESWLFDVTCYFIYYFAGPASLVVAKASAFAAIGYGVLRLSRLAADWWLALFCSGLAILAMATRLSLQPATIACGFLVLTLWFLFRRDYAHRGGRSASFRPWPLAVVLLIWVNVDRSFLIGLCVVALAWVGEVADELIVKNRRAADRTSPASRGILSRLAWLLVLIVSCLLNPAHARAFVTAADWIAGGAGAATDAGAARTPTSTFLTDYLSTAGRTPAGLAYFPLLAFGMIALAANVSKLCWKQVLPWLALALWSGWQVRGVPFFAVTAGPMLAWNLQETARRWMERSRGAGRAWLRLGRELARGALMVAALAALVCAWPGWLQAPPFERRAWELEPAPSLRRAAEELQRWHKEGLLATQARGLHLSRGAASVFAWFCPQDNGIQDDRLASEVLGVAHRGGRAGDAPPAHDWRQRFRTENINHVIVYDADRARLFTALDHFWSDSSQWPLLRLEGDLAIFGWRDPDDPRAADRFRGLELDFNRLAFHPADDRKAPAKRPEREPERRHWWEAFWKRLPPRSLDRDEASLYLLRVEALRRTAPLRHLETWETSHSAALVAGAGRWTFPAAALDAHNRLVLLRPEIPSQQSALKELPALDRLTPLIQKRFALSRDDAPPALLFLAIRAARRGIAANPSDAQAYLILGECYLALLHDTRERVWGARFGELSWLRQAQTSEALNEAIRLKPDMAQAHFDLARLFEEMGYLDLTLTHLRTYVKLVREARAAETGGAKADPTLLESHEQGVSQLAKVVAEREQKFTREAGKARVVDRAEAARQLKLGGKALDILTKSDVAAFGTPGVKMELDLLLRTGRANDALEWAVDQAGALGEADYRARRVYALAALGDYAAAEDECSAIGMGAQGEGSQRPKSMLAMLVGQNLLDDVVASWNVGHLLARAASRPELYHRILGEAQKMRDQANAVVLLGVLALEEGQVEAAALAFRYALALWKDETAAATGGGIDFAGRPVAQGYLRLLE